MLGGKHFYSLVEKRLKGSVHICVTACDTLTDPPRTELIFIFSLQKREDEVELQVVVFLFKCLSSNVALVVRPASAHQQKEHRT